MSGTNLDDLAVLVAVTEAGGLGAAATRLGQPKSTLSRRLAALEAALGQRLFERVGRGLVPTPQGRALADSAGPHVAALHDAARRAAESEKAPSGVVRLTAPSDLASILLVEPLTRFRARYPEIRVHLEPSGALVDLQRDGFDLAVRAAPRVVAPDVVARAVADSVLQLFASPSYVAQRGLPGRPEELPHHTFIGFRAPGRPRAEPFDDDALLLTGPGGAEVAIDVRPQLQVTEFLVMRGFVVSGHGLGLLPAVFARADVERGALVPVLPEWSRHAGALWVVHAAGRQLPRRVRLLRDHLVEALRTPAR